MSSEFCLECGARLAVPAGRHDGQEGGGGGARAGPLSMSEVANLRGFLLRADPVVE
jgi:hypothetical protein